MDLGEGRWVQETLAKVERNDAVKQQLWGLDLGLADLPSIGTPIVAGRPLSWLSLGRHFMRCDRYSSCKASYVVASGK